MAPIIHCVRHAQGYHNLTSANHTIRDPKLTPHGEDQCRALQAAFPHHDTIDLIVASPLRRTLYTALLSFQQTIEARDLRIIALPSLQETSALPCDTGSEVYDLAKEFGRQAVDINLLEDGWEKKQGMFAANPRAINERAADARSWLFNRPEKEIVVVTHGGFLHYMTEDWTDYDRHHGTGWTNTEYRTYEFNSKNPEMARLVETDESHQRRLDRSIATVRTLQLQQPEPEPIPVHLETEDPLHKDSGKPHLHLTALSNQLHHLKDKIHLPHMPHMPHRHIRSSSISAPSA